MATYLIDTCVWRDFMEERKNRQGVPLGEHAFACLRKVLAEKANILLCEVLIKELRRKYTREEIEEIFSLLGATGQLRWTEPEPEEVNAAEELSRSRTLPFADCLYAVMARNRGAQVITRDGHFFEKLADITVSKLPEGLG